MTEIKLRPHQGTLIKGIQSNWKKGIKRIIGFLATRGGKTYCFSYLAKKTNDNGKKVLILTNRKTLFKQTGSAIIEFGIKPYFINADTKVVRNDYMTYVAMEQTLSRRLHLPEVIKMVESVSLVICDEAHIASFDKILNLPLFKDKYILGVTGSPKRDGQQPELSATYQQIVIGAYTADLEPEYCVPARVFTNPFDMKGVSKNYDGEFNNQETFNRFDSPKLYQGAVNNWLKHAKDKVTLCYCVNIVHAAKTCVQFNNNGINCKFISSGRIKPKLSENPNKGAITKYKLALEEWEYLEKYKHLTGEPEQIISEWVSGEFVLLINVDMLTFGYDNNLIDCILVNRAINSIPLWLQIANRGGTPRSGKDNFILLDQGGNTDRLGDYNFKHEWSLFHKKPTGDGVAAVKECKKCQSLILASAMVCDWCGFIQPKSKEQKEIELIERTPLREMPMNTIADIENVAKVKKYKKPWVFRTVYFKFGEKEFKKYLRSNNYHWSYIYRLIGQYNSQNKNK